MRISTQFTIISMHPIKGRLIVPGTRFSYGLAAAFLLDLYLLGETRSENNRLNFSIKQNGDPLHDRLSDIIQASTRPRRILYWVRKLSWRYRQNLKESLGDLISNGSIRHEKKYFLGLFPYNRYYFNDPRLRSSLVTQLREVVINGKSPSDEQVMLLGLMKATASLHHLSAEFRERKVIRSRVREIFKKDEYRSETQLFIVQVMSAVKMLIASDESANVA
jgi:hypothetical protein